MSLAHKEFEKRLYQWALEDWRRELEEDFRLLRKVADPVPLRIIEALDKPRRFLFAKALVKRFTPAHVLAQCGDSFTDEDAQLIQIYIDAVTSVVSGPTSIGSEDDRYLSATSLCELDRTSFKKAIVTRLTPVLGKEYENCGGGEWRYYTSVGPWEIVTCIDLGGRSHQLCYAHNIRCSKHPFLAEHISLLSWLGISSQTDWSGLTQSDIEPIAESLAEIIAHFVRSAPSLLQGLSPKMTDR